MSSEQFERFKGFAVLWGGLNVIGAGIAGALGYGIEAAIGGIILVCAGAALAFSRRGERRNDSGRAKGDL